METANYIAKSTVHRSSLLGVDGKSVVDRFTLLNGHLTRSAGRSAAALFAEPVVTAKGDELEIVWYSSQPGQPAPFTTRDAEGRTIVADRLRRRLQEIAPLLDDAEIGPLLGRALYIADAADIIAVDSEPVLTNWGMLPETVPASDRTALAAHFTATLGPYAPFPAPAIAAAASTGAAAGKGNVSTGLRSGAAWLRRGIGGAVGGTGDTGDGGGGTGSGSGGIAGADAPGPREGRGLAWATAVATAVAVALALPGVLGSATTNAAPDTGALTTVRKGTADLKALVDATSRAVATAQCTADGTLVPQDPGVALPPPAVPLTPTPSDTQGTYADMMKAATQSTVFVFTCSTAEPGKDDSDCPNYGEEKSDPSLTFDGFGSGFFIGPSLIVTNAHVVSGAKKIMITNGYLRKVYTATVKATTPVKDMESKLRDFAVLEVKVDNPPPSLRLSTNVQLLQPVVVAGFPGVTTASNSAELKPLLIDRNQTAAPGVTTVSGNIIHLADMEGRRPILYTSAQIATGNSGGPMLDLCGGVLGVNTWSNAVNDVKNLGRGFAYMAQAAKSLVVFLDEAGIHYDKTDAACTPAPQATPSPVSTTPPGSPPPVK